MSLFRCPVCAAPLTRQERTYTCPNGHSYDLASEGIAIDMTVFYKRIITLAIVYLLSAALGAMTTAVMNYSVSSFFTCRIRVKMSEKIAKIPIKTVDSTPNGEII